MTGWTALVRLKLLKGFFIAGKKKGMAGWILTLLSHTPVIYFLER